LAIFYFDIFELEGDKVELFSRFWGKCSQPLEYMIMLEFFFDDSGQARHEPFICIAGYLGLDEWWNGFIPEWRCKLLEHGIDQVHMRQLIHLKGQYKTWVMSKEMLF